MNQMEEQNKTPEKELNKMEKANLSDVEFKTLVIRMLKELIEYGNNIKEEMQVTLSEKKKNLQGINSEGEEARIQINDLEHKEEINIQPEQNEETRIKKKMKRILKAVREKETVTSVLNSTSDRLAISSLLSSFSGVLICYLGHISLSRHTCYIVRGRALGCLLYTSDAADEVY